MPRRINVFGNPLSYDVGVSYAGNFPVDRTQPIKEGDDVSQPTKDTVVNYVKDMTHGVEGGPSNANEFPIGGAPEILKFETADGLPPPLSVKTNADGQYIDHSSRLGQLLESHSNSALVEDDNSSNSSTFTVPDVYPNESSFIKKNQGDSSFIKKGKSASGDVSGNRVLSNGTTGAPKSEVFEKYVSPILRNNRFSSGKTLESIKGHDKKFNPTHPSEGFGSYKRYSTVGTDLSDGVLAQIGPMLSLRATKELDSISRTGYGKAGTDGTGAKAASLLPGLAQIGAAKVTTDDLEVDSVLEALIAGQADPVNVDAGSSGPRKVIDLKTSYGQMNNVLEPFSGLLPLGMVAAGAALAIALNLALKAILAFFLLITNASSSNSQKRDEIGRFLPGNSRFNPAFEKTSFPPIPLPAKLFGLQETVNPFGDAVTEGIKVFFGGSIGGSLKRVLESPGFYVTFCRSIVRSAAELIRGLDDVGTGSPIQIAENVIGFIDTIKSSKVVIVLNIFAQIGDSSLTQAERLKRFPPLTEITSDSDIDNLEGLDAMRARMPGSLVTAWGASTTPSVMILPNNAARAMLATGNNNLSSFLFNRTKIENKIISRISAKDVEIIEDTLDAEYLPFYFHDLRTNEIISFQAFLGNLTEDFTANYESVEGYGRIDAIKLYKNTNRKIGVQFYVAATNQEDFDAMWLKFNKLTTLLYPQWSKGTVLNPDNSKFVQPFSQVPTASPVCRVRVGDLWTSNYSKFSLSRIFGLGSEETLKFEGTKYKDDSFIKDKADFILWDVKRTGRELRPETIWLLEPGDYEASPKDQGALGAAASAIGLGTPNPRVIAKLRVHTRVKIVKAHNASSYSVKIIDKDNVGLPSAIVKSNILVSLSHLSMTYDTIVSLGLEDKDGSNTNNNLGDINMAEFLSSKENAVIRGFEAAKGRGIACVIDSMGLDWNNVPWETTVHGARAPKMCKITMAMSVIHDIAPGIDADGFNRAPVYTVGRQSKTMAGKANTHAFTSNYAKIRKSLI